MLNRSRGIPEEFRVRLASSVLPIRRCLSVESIASSILNRQDTYRYGNRILISGNLRAWRMGIRNGGAVDAIQKQCKE